jgi:hypothetical protein
MGQPPGVLQRHRMSWQQICVGRHHAGARCGVHVDGNLLRFWIGDQLVKTAARTSRGEVRNKRASRTRDEAYQDSKCQGSTKRIRQPSQAGGLRGEVQSPQSQRLRIGERIGAGSRALHVSTVPHGRRRFTLTRS